jgi:hypothetical protein
MEMHLLAYGLFVFAHVPLSFPAVETGSRTLRPCFFSTACAFTRTRAPHEIGKKIKKKEKRNNERPF